MNHLKTFLQQMPTKADERTGSGQMDKYTIVGLVNLISGIICLVSGSVMYFFAMESYLSIVCLGLVCFLGWLLNRLGYSQIATVILVAALLIVIQYNIFQGYGMHDVAIIAWPAIIFFVGLFFGSRTIPYITAITMILAVMTKVLPNARNFTGYADTGDLIVMLLIIAGFSLIGSAILRGSERSIFDLRESEERYRQLYENSPVGLYRTTPDGRILLANPIMVEMLGFSSFEELSARNLEKEGFAPDYARDQFKEMIEKTGEIKGLEAVWTRRDGTTIFVRESAGITRDAQGKTLYYDGMIEDITGQKRLEKAFKQSEAKYRRMVETANEGVIVLDPDARMTLVNQQMASMLGYPIEDLLGLKLDALLFEEDLEDHQAQMQLRTRGQSAVYERCLRRRDGTRLWTIISATPTTDGEGRFDGAFGMVTDITERKRAEEAIRQQNAELTVLNQIGQRLSKLAGPAEILESIFMEIGKVLDDRNLFITLYDKERQYISFEVYTLDGERLVGKGRPLADGITDYIIRNNQPFLVKQDISEARRSRGITLRGRPARSFIGVPIHTDDEVLGVIALQNYDYENVYNEHHLELLTTIAAQASSALANARLYSAVQQELEERKRAELALVETQALTHAIVESTSDLIWSVDPENFGLLMFNHGLKDYFFQMREMQIHAGLRPEELFPPGDFVRQWREFYQRALTEGSYTVEYYAYAGAITLQLTFNLLKRDGKVFGISVFGKDITERKHAEEQLRESESRFRTIIEDAPIGISIGRSGKLLYANPAYVRLHGFTSVDEVVGRPTLERVAPRDQPATLERARQRARGLFLEEKPYELTGLRQDGTEVLMLVAVSQVKLADGLANIGFFQDITVRKQVEVKIRAALEEKETLLREVHHRVKNNLQVIIALIKMRTRMTQEAGTLQFLTELESQAHTMALVYEQLYQSENLAQVGMAQYLRQLTSHVLDTYGRRDAIQFHLDAPLTLDVAQATPCGLIVNELFANILKYAFPPDFQGNPSVSIRLWQDGETYHLTVSDNGVGLPPGYDWRAGQTMGLRLVNLWVTHQLGGTLAVSGDTGTMFAITFDLMD